MPGAARCLLALETATSFASVALVAGGELRAEVIVTGARPHSARVLPAVQAALELGGARLEEVDAFAVSIGPGSFTGLRVGVATVKGLAFGDERPVAAVPTLAALAAGAPADRACLACLDARRNELYAAAFGPGEGEREAWLPEGVYDPATLAARAPRPCLVVGCSGEEAALAGLLARLGPDASLLPLAPPRALTVARLGLRLIARGKGVPASALAPRYVRRAEAEVRRTGERFERPAGE